MSAHDSTYTASDLVAAIVQEKARCMTDAYTTKMRLNKTLGIKAVNITCSSRQIFHAFSHLLHVQSTCTPLLNCMPLLEYDRVSTLYGQKADHILHNHQQAFQGELTTTF